MLQKEQTINNPEYFEILTEIKEKLGYIYI